MVTIALPWLQSASAVERHSDVEWRVPALLSLLRVLGCLPRLDSAEARAAGVREALYGTLFVKRPRCWRAVVLCPERRRPAPTLWRATLTGNADGSRPKAAKRTRASARLDAEHSQSTHRQCPVDELRFSDSADRQRTEWSPPLRAIPRAATLYSVGSARGSRP